MGGLLLQNWKKRKCQKDSCVYKEYYNSTEGVAGGWYLVTGSRTLGIALQLHRLGSAHCRLTPCFTHAAL